MEVTAAHVEAIPRGNLHVPRAEFAAVWAAAELHLTDSYSAGVAMTCRWIATSMAPSVLGGLMPARSPVTWRAARAHEELIEAEFLAAEVLSLKRPLPAWVADRPAWLAGVLAVFDWCWRRAAPAPRAPVVASQLTDRA
jgi:hypothetical protein